MNVILKPELERLIEKQIQSGKFTYPDEVIEEALHLLEQRNHYDQWVDEIGQKIDIAASQLDQGEGMDIEPVMVQLRQRLYQSQEDR